MAVSARRQKDHEAILGAVRMRADGAQLGDIAPLVPLPERTLIRRLNAMVASGLLEKSDRSRAARYRIPGAQVVVEPAVVVAQDAVPLSPAGAELLALVSRPIPQREPVGYDRDFLDAYVPNQTRYLSDAERAHLLAIGTSRQPVQPAGTHARTILNRLLIDLAFNSSRLEGNTYSLLDTQRLLDMGEAADDKSPIDAQMILNHKDAIEFLVGSIEDIAFNPASILNLHGLLANNLLPDRNAVGRLRRVPVGIGLSVYTPPEIPQLIEECFAEILRKAELIADPFEQSFFVMVQLPYLQPFDDVNKRVSRLAANIPLIKANLSPLSFIDVPGDIYIQAMLAVYELNRVELLRDVYMWAYARSAKKYAIVQQNLGEPDPFILKHRTALKEIVREVVVGALGKKAASKRVAAFGGANIVEAERARFIEKAEEELLSLHEGNYARYRVRPAEFAAWQKAWTAKGRAKAN